MAPNLIRREQFSDTTHDQGCADGQQDDGIDSLDSLGFVQDSLLT